MKIESAADHEKALARVSELMDIERPYPSQEKELDVLVDVVVAYEEVHHPFKKPGLARRVMKRWPKGKHSGKHSGKRIGGFKLKFEFNLLWWSIHFAFSPWCKSIQVGPVHIWIETAYEK